MRKVRKSVNVKKNEYNLISTIFFYLNLSKILHFLVFKTKRERENINNFMIRRMWLNFNIDITINTKLSKLCYVMEYCFIFIYYL